MNPRRGLSLSETMFSLAFLGLVMIVILNIFPTSMASVRSAEYRSQADSIAQTCLERHLYTRFADLPVGLSKDLKTESLAPIDYSVHLDVLKADGDEQYLRRLRVTVRWEFKGVHREVVRETLTHRLAHQTR
jgi:hypothetical protein